MNNSVGKVSERWELRKDSIDNKILYVCPPAWIGVQHLVSDAVSVFCFHVLQ